MINRISIRAHVYTTESKKKVKQSLYNFTGFYVEVSEERTEGHFGNEITILTCEISNRKKAEKLWKSIVGRLSEEDRNRIVEELELRLDDENNLRLKFDKQKSLTEKKLKLISKGDGIQVTVKFITYPSNRKAVTQEIIEWMKHEPN